MKGKEKLSPHTASGIPSHNLRLAAVSASFSLCINKPYLLACPSRSKRRGKAALRMNPGESLKC